jgi:hypothetical protein
MLRFYRRDGLDSKSDAGIAPGNSINHGRNEGRCQKGTAADSHLSPSRISEKLDVFYRLAQFIERRHAAIKQSPTVSRRFDTSGVTIKQTYTQGTFQFCNRSRNGRLGYVESSGCLVHAASLCDRDKNMEVEQFHA